MEFSEMQTISAIAHRPSWGSTIKRNNRKHQEQPRESGRGVETLVHSTHSFRTPLRCEG